MHTLEVQAAAHFLTPTATVNRAIVLPSRLRLPLIRLERFADEGNICKHSNKSCAAQQAVLLAASAAFLACSEVTKAAVRLETRCCWDKVSQFRDATRAKLHTAGGRASPGFAITVAPSPASAACGDGASLLANRQPRDENDDVSGGSN